MSKYKVGDKFEVLTNVLNNYGVYEGDIVVLFEIESDKIHGFKSNKTEVTLYISEKLVRKVNDACFKTSNRYKLHKYILSTGFTKQDLSLALNKNQSYLTTETRESQFINRGDMSDARYKSLRKQIKEAINKINLLHDSPVENPLIASEINQTLVDVEPKEKVDHKKLEVNVNGQVFDFPPNKSVSIEILTKKPSNNGAFILGLVFFVMLIIFGIGCLIYKAA